MNVVDSSAWIEYFIGSEISLEYTDIIEDFDNLLVPSITIFEVYKYILREESETVANEANNFMINGNVINLTPEESKNAAQLSAKYKLPMADCIIYSSVLKYDATLYTHDIDFNGLQSVIYIKK